MLVLKMVSVLLVLCTLSLLFSCTFAPKHCNLLVRMLLLAYCGELGH